MIDPSHIVCPDCGTVNRVPPARRGSGPRCGNCRKPLFEGRPIAVDVAGFERHRRHDGIPLLVDVWAPWCGPCRMMVPMFERAAGELEPGMRLLKLNADEAPAVSAEFGIRGIPTLLLFHDGSLVAQQSGAMAAEAIVQWARRHWPSAQAAPPVD